MHKGPGWLKWCLPAEAEGLLLEAALPGRRVKRRRGRPGRLPEWLGCEVSVGLRADFLGYLKALRPPVLLDRQ